MQSICISLIDDDERGRLQTVTSLFALDLAFIPVKLLWRPVRHSSFSGDIGKLLCRATASSATQARPGQTLSLRYVHQRRDACMHFIIFVSLNISTVDVVEWTIIIRIRRIRIILFLQGGWYKATKKYL